MRISRHPARLVTTSRLALCGGAVILTLTFGLFAFYDGPFASRSTGPVVIALSPLVH